jgi:hypothetical protein
VIKISLRYRKYVWMAAGLAAALLLYNLVYEPLYRDYKDTLEQIQLTQEKLHHSRQLLLQKEALDRQIRDLEAAVKRAESMMFKGETTSVVGAQMQEIMNSICSKNGADIRQTRVLKVDEVGPYKEICINTDLLSTVEGLAKIIFDLEHSNYLFMISEISMTASSRKTPDDVRTRMTVVGLMREEKNK